MNIEITNRDELENINFSSLNNGSIYKSVSEVMTIQLTIISNQTINWLGLRLNLSDQAYENIFFKNNQRSIYLYPNTPINNGDIINFNIQFKSTDTLNDLIGNSFINMLFAKKSKLDNYIEYGVPLFSHPNIEQV